MIHLNMMERNLIILALNKGKENETIYDFDNKENIDRLIHSIKLKFKEEVERQEKRNKRRKSEGQAK